MKLRAICFVLLACCTIACAFTRHAMSEQLLRGQDLSYGIYIYHMLVLNTFVQVGWSGAGRYLVAATGVAIVAAAASWLIVERPALRLKGSSPWPTFGPARLGLVVSDSRA